MQFQRPLQLRPRLRVQPKVHVGLPDGVPNGSLHLRLPVELSRDPRRRPVQRRSHLQVRIGLGARARLVGRAGLRQQIVLQKIVDRLGHRRFPVRADALPDADHRGRDEHQGEGAGGDQRRAVAARELAGTVGRRRRNRQHRFVPQIPPNVRGEIRGRAVAARPVLFERLQRDGVQVAAHLFGQRRRLGLALASHVRRRGRVLRADLGARLGRILLAQPPQEFVECDFSQIERRRARQQFVKNDAERIDVGARVDILARRIGLLRAHVFRSADQRPHAREQGVRSQLLGQRLGHSEIDDLRRRLGHPLR